MADGFAASLFRARVLLAILFLAATVPLSAGCGASAAAAEAPRADDAEGDAGGGRIAEAPEPPNIIVIPTDDLAAWDLSPEMLERMPNLKKEIVEKSTTFENSFVTNSVYCPLRLPLERLGRFSLL